MAPVNIKYIVSFSSQDDFHKANNLVTSDGSKCWLSNRKNCSGKTELVLQLEKSTQLAYLDIGAVWCATLEIRVGRSDWPQTTEFKPLLPTVMVMSALDCQLDRSVKTTKMLSTKDFSQEVACELWDRLHITCRQPYRKDVQFGISFLHIRDVIHTSSSEVPTGADGNQMGKSVLDTSSIQKHFFGKTPKTGDDSPTDMLKYRLMKMAGSTENGCEQPQALSRTAMLVLKASENNNSYSPRRIPSPLSKKGLFSEHLAKKNDVPINEEMKTFLPTLNVTAEDIDNVTIADLRHKFERRIRRKLTKEERKTYSEICQDFFWDLVDKNNKSPETERPGSVCGGKTQKKRKEADIKSDNLSHRLDTTGSASKMKVTPSRKRETPSIQQQQDLDDRTMSTKVVVDIDRIVVSKSSDVIKDDWIKSSNPETSTKKNFLFKVSASRNDSTISSSDVITDLSSASVSAITYCDKKISSGIVKKRRKFNPDETDTAFLSSDKNLSLTSSHSPFSKSMTSGTRTPPVLKLTNGTWNNECKTITPEENLIESISYQRESHHNMIPEAIESPLRKIIARDDGNKASTNVYSPLRSIKSPITFNSGAVCPQKPAKLKKLSKTSFDLFQEFSMEIMNSDNETEALDEKTDFLTDEDVPSNRKSANRINSSLDVLSAKDTIKIVSSTNSTPQKSSLQVLDKRTPKSVKGKFYRMYTSRNKLKSDSHEEISPVSRHSPSPSNLSFHAHGVRNCLSNEIDNRGKSREQTATNFDDNSSPNKCKILPYKIDGKKKQQGRFNQSTDLSKSNLCEEISKDQEKKEVSSHSSHLNDRSNQRSKWDRKKAEEDTSKQRAKSTPPRKALEDASFCEKCFGIYPADTIITHQTFCMAPPSHIVGSAVATAQPTPADDTHEMFIDDTADFAECPICLQRFPQDVLLVHASECGI